MANQTQVVVQQPKSQSIQELMNTPIVMKKIASCLGSEKKASAFASSVISIATGSNQLKQCTPMSVLGSAMVAATLDLSVVPTLGLAYIVPYKGTATFQIGFKGLIELAERSGQFKNIIDEVVYEGQLVKKNKFTGEYVFDEDAKVSDKVIGYMARFDLINGFSKTIFWTIEEVEAHAKKYSQAYRSGITSPWKTDFDAMGRKTVLKSLFAKYAPKSISMDLQNAIRFDQAAVKLNIDDNTLTEDDLNINAFDAEYVDNSRGVDAVDEEVDPAGDLFGNK